MNQPTPTPPSRAEIAYRLRKLAAYMADLASEMDYFKLSEIATHGLELAGASSIAVQWAEEIDKELAAELRAATKL